jgi:8-oxo-dGTP diphosphatase
MAAGQDWLEPPAWHASLPGVVLTAAGLVGDGHGGVLIVKTNYREQWSLPGGICEFGEPPEAGCAREVAEELGLELPVGRMLAVDWRMPQALYGPGSRPAVSFIFDCGTLTSLADVRLQADEIDDCRFADEAELTDLVVPATVSRIRVALAARLSGCGGYVPDWQPDRPG